jgi:riboflavin kinase/FMN adenylyltransferase
VANLGNKPTVGQHAVGLEVHLLGYGGPEIYGEQLVFEFNGRLRGEQKFSGLEALKAQIAGDIELAKKKLSLI